MTARRRSWTLTPQLMVRLPLLVALPIPSSSLSGTLTGHAVDFFLFGPSSKVRDAVMGAVRSRREWLRRLMAARFTAENKIRLLRGAWRTLTARSLLVWLRPRVTPELVLRLPVLVVTLRPPPNVLGWAAASTRAASSVMKRRGSNEETWATFTFTPPLVSHRHRHPTHPLPLVRKLVHTALSCATVVPPCVCAVSTPDV